MRYLSVCSGIEAASVAWHELGWEPVAFSEIEPFPSAVLAHHYPSVPNWGDMTKFKEWPDESIDLLVGGTPCQSFSVAGLRKGLDDPRGNLMLTYLAIADKYRPEWLVWENVPGVLSSNGGRDFGTFLGGLGELGYGFAYRILDAQYFGVAQRRRRVFVVANARSWQRAAAVLFERHSLSGNPAPSRETGQGSAPGAKGCAPVSGEVSAINFKPIIPQGCGGDIAPTLNSAFGSKLGLDNQHIDSGAGLFVRDVMGTGSKGGCATVAVAWTGDGVTADPISASEGRTYTHEGTSFRLHNCVQRPVAIAIRTANTSSNGCGIDEETSYTLDQAQGQAVAFEPGSIARNAGPVGESPLARTLRREMGDNQPAVRIGMQVRRLTPVECERLQGFRDGYTNIPWRKKPKAPDGPRYKSLGNSMAVPVMRWIGGRIAMVEKMPGKSHE
jgi:DNA (cytosine-5)-methyltransferase 1